MHQSELGVFLLASDAITTRLTDKASKAIAKIPAHELPQYGGYTAGSALELPGNRIGRKMESIVHGDATPASPTAST
ncbi:hypothetical protein J2X01_000355 [Arthrobacter ginsengisoli]|uniref:Uncharacterized protein n=1 Tax=Arthrobacter ginsengisoli TaxID=1356565 RepID=A0ABU1U7D0_9MICC|nr:hypothetical protein [Arthrobacter ginsengisoli]MDR7081086.1 hypothetical protein [Arthrobacter ginsengisoli]